jgi:hypothetical protein
MSLVLLNLVSFVSKLITHNSSRLHGLLSPFFLVHDSSHKASFQNPVSSSVNFCLDKGDFDVEVGACK